MDAGAGRSPFNEAAATSPTPLRAHRKAAKMKELASGAASGFGTVQVRGMVALGLLSTLFVAFAATPAQATASAAALADPTLFLGQHAVIKGQVAGGSRPLVLQVKSGEAWTTVARGSSSGAGGYRLQDPKSRVATYRVRAPRSNSRAGWTSTSMRPRWQSTLAPGSQLVAGQGLRSPDGRFDLLMQPDGNLVEYRAGQTTGAIWNSGTPGHPGAHVTLQPDGNLVVYDTNGAALWNTRTAGLGTKVLRLQNDSNVVLYARADRALWSTKSGARYDTLFPGQSLRAGELLSSPDRSFDLVMQPDGNFVEYHGGTTTNAIWNSQTVGHPGSQVTMQSDGNLVVYDTAGTPVWNTETAGMGAALLRIQNDSNVVVYAGRRALWNRSGALFDQLRSGWRLDSGEQLVSTNHAYRLLMQPDGNLVEYPMNGSTAIWNTGTAGHPGAYAIMQGDGNLVVYSAGGTALWNAATVGHPNSILYMQADGNVVIYNNGTAIWSKNGPISPPGAIGAITRAQSWVDAAVPYSQTAYYTNQYGTYRTDCSGYVSMAWQLGSSYNTRTLPNVSHPISKGDLTAGDILLNQTSHVVLFEKWANADHTQYWAYEETPNQAKHRIIPYPYWSGYGTFEPYRKN